MANNNRREIELALSITTANADALAKLQRDVRDLAKEGGDAAPAFQKLADELGQLAEQAKQLTALEGLTQELKAAATAQVDAASKSTALKQTLDQLVAATDAAREAERAKNLELSNAKRAVQEAQDAIAKFKNDTSDAGKNTAGYTIKLVELKGALLDARAAKRDLTAQLDALKVKTQEASSAVKDQGKAYKDAAKDTTDATTAMRGLQAQVDGVTEKYRAAGGAADDLANAQKNLGTAAAGVRAAIQGVIADQDRLAQAERDAANEALRQGAIIADTKRKQAAQAKAEADGIIADYQRMERAQQDAARSAKAAGDAISNAFGTVGQRSAQEIRREIERVREAMRLLATSGAATGTELATAMQRGETAINGLQRELREVTGTLTMADKAAGLFKNSMGQIAAGNVIADGVGYLVNKVKEMGREFVQANLDMERLTRTLTQITGSAKGAADQIAFLRDVSNKAGVSVSAITDSFIRFQAAAAASGTSATEINAIFQAVTVSGSKMGMSADRVALALDALGQMASKGTVSMEELRQQLGDSLPGATAIAAKGLGLTTGELTKLVESGQLSTEQFFPAFRRGLEETFGSADKNVTGLVQAFARLGNKFTELYQQAADSTAFKLLAQSADVLTRNFDSLVSVIGGLGKALVALKLVDYISSLGRMGEVSRQAATGVAAQTTAVQGSTAATAANTAATATNTAGKAANASALVAQGAAAAGTRNAVTGLTTAQTSGTAATAANTSATSANTAAKTANALATRAQAAADAAMSAASTVAVGAMRAAGAAATAAAGAARGLMAAMGGLPGVFVMVALNAKELGTWLGETVAKWGEAGAAMRKYEAEMAAQAAREKQMAADREAAQAKALQAIQREVAGMQTRREVLLAEEATAQKATDTQAKRADLIERTAKLYGDETKALEASEQATRTNLAAAEAELSARNKVVIALQEEIAKREKLLADSGVRNEKATEELQKLRDLLGLKTQEEEKLRATTELLRLESAERRIATQAYQDNSEKIGDYKQAMEDARKTLVDIQTMEKAGLPVKEALAEAEQNLGVQTRLYNDAVKDKLAKLQAEGALEQANLNIKTAGLQVRQQELLSQAASAKESGNYTAAINLEIEAKKIQIEITRLNAEAKRLEAEATIKTANAELEQLRTTGTLTESKRLEIEARIANAKAKQVEAQGSETAVRNLEREIEALRRGTSARKDSANAIDAEAAARERLISAQEKELDLQTRALKLQEAKRTAGTIQGADAVPSFESKEQADAWLVEWKKQYQRDNPFSTKSGGQLGNFMYDMTMFEFNKELDAMALRNAMKGNGNATTSTQTPLEAARSGQTTTVNITLDGTTRSINTDAAGAATLQDVLRGLGAASTRAS